MSHHKTRKSLNSKILQPDLDQHGVKLISAGLDEVPMVYENMEKVMAARTDLVEPLARFFPRLVKVTQTGERAQD
jgi:tRNA-splicing ligase RtcB (3'-phosphate/5'-hydroxy nucleic acid ligase)